MKKPGNKRVVDDQEILRFNLTRENKGQTEFKRVQMLEELHRLGYPKHDSILRAFSAGVNPPILRIARGVYVFNPKPVFKDRLQTALEEYTKLANPKNYKNGQYEEVLSEEQCIKFLKSKGYKILKPVTEYEEIQTPDVYRHNIGDNTSVRILSFITFSKCGEKREHICEC